MSDNINNLQNLYKEIYIELTKKQTVTILDINRIKYFEYLIAKEIVNTFICNISIDQDLPKYCCVLTNMNKLFENTNFNEPLNNWNVNNKIVFYEDIDLANKEIDIYKKSRLFAFPRLIEEIKAVKGTLIINDELPDLPLNNYLSIASSALKYYAMDTNEKYLNRIKALDTLFIINTFEHWNEIIKFSDIMIIVKNSLQYWKIKCYIGLHLSKQYDANQMIIAFS